LQEDVTKADGYRFLITSIMEKISKEEVVQDFLELIQNTCTIEIVFDGEFVATTLGSIDGRFACKDIGCCLDRIFFYSRGIELDLFRQL